MNIDTIKKEYEYKNTEKNIYLNDLKDIIIQTSYFLEGNCIYYHGTLTEFNELYFKQLNLFYLGKQELNNICEIGFNAGHSTMLMLLGRDKKPLNFTIFDIGHHPYTRPCYKYIKEKFSNVNFEYIEGDSTITIPHWINEHSEQINKYDLIHVDGGHSEHCISNDMKNADILLKKDGIMIIDDTHDITINSYVDKYINNGNYSEIILLQTFGYKHRIIKKIN